MIVNLLMLACGGIAGAALGRLIRMPLWPLTGAIIGSGAVHLAVGMEVVVPLGWTFIAQWLDGNTYIEPHGTDLEWPFRARFALLSKQLGHHRLAVDDLRRRACWRGLGRLPGKAEKAMDA